MAASDRSGAVQTCAVRATLLATAGAIAIGWSAPSWAQTPPDGEAATTPSESDEFELVVTARRRDENLQRTPVSVVALTGEALEQRSVTNLSDVAQFAPNVNIAPDFTVGNAASSVFIRGVGQTDYRIFSDPAVATYVDGVFIPRAIGGLMDLLDLERVEVLRGPQGTLYGKNSVAGAINLVSKRPSSNEEGYLQLSAGSFGRYEARGSVNAPLSGKLALRISGLVRTYDGYGRIINDLDKNGLLNDSAQRHDQNLVGGRAQLLWEDGDFEALLSVDGLQSRSNGSLRHAFGTRSISLGGTYNTLVTNNRLNLPLFNLSLVPSDPFQSTGNYPEASDLDVFGTSLTLSRTFGGVTFRSISSYRTLKNQIRADIDATLADVWHQDEFNNQEQFGQEFQAAGELFGDRLNYVLGLFYFKEDIDRSLTSVQLLPLTLLGLYPASLSVRTDGVVSSKSYAAFGQGTFKITPELSVTGGLRWTHEKKSMSLDRKNSAGIPGITPTQGIIGSNTGDWSDISPRLGLEYQWTPDLMTYVSAARGFKSGGFNGRPSPLLPNNGLLPYDPETLTTYEVGLRSSWLGGRLRFNATGFYSEYKDIQTTATMVVNGQVTVIVGNAASATMKGLELDLTAAPTNNLRLNANFGYIDAEYDSITGASTLFKNNRNGLGAAVPAGPDSVFPLSPEYSASGGVEYNLPMGRSLGSLRSRIDVSYQSETSPDTNPFRADSATGALLPKSEQLDARTVVNTRITYTSPGGKYELAGYVTNLFNELYRVAAIDFNTGFGFEQYGAPRQIGASFKVSF